MCRYLILNRISSLLFLILFLTASFKNYNEEKKGSKKIVLTPNLIASQRDQSFPVPLTDSLYVLKMEGSVFSALNTDKWVFKFIYVREDSLTLRCWYADGFLGRTFATQYVFQLKPTKINILKYSTNMYFGDIVLQRSDVRKIKKLIKEKNVETVLFTPQLNPGTHFDIYDYAGNSQ